MSREIRLPCYGIVISTGDLPDGPAAAFCHPVVTISSDLETRPPDGKTWDSIEEYEHAGAMNAIESIVLAHYLAGICITTPQYIEGIETAVEACANNIL